MTTPPWCREKVMVYYYYYYYYLLLGGVLIIHEGIVGQHECQEEMKVENDVFWDGWMICHFSIV